MSKRSDEDHNYFKLYWRSHASYLLIFYNDLSGFLSSNLSTYMKQSRSKYSEMKLKTLLLLVTIILSVATGFSLFGRLYSLGDNLILMDTNIHSGFWEVIPEYESRSREFKIENPTMYPLILELKAHNFVPTTSSTMIKVTWNYTGEPLLPNEMVPLKITLENYSQGYDLFVSLDLNVLGFVSDSM